MPLAEGQHLWWEWAGISAGAPSAALKLARLHRASAGRWGGLIGELAEGGSRPFPGLLVQRS